MMKTCNKECQVSGRLSVRVWGWWGPSADWIQKPRPGGAALGVDQMSLQRQDLHHTAAYSNMVVHRQSTASTACASGCLNLGCGFETLQACHSMQSVVVGVINQTEDSH